MTTNADKTEHVSVKGVNHFNLKESTQLFHSSFASGYNTEKRQAAIHALLRYNTHSDGAHRHTRTQGGLHPAFVLFNRFPKEGNGIGPTELVNASLCDVFDAVSSVSFSRIFGSLHTKITMHNRLDGGFSILIRCGGVNAADLQQEHITLDLYVTLQEPQDKHINGDISMLVQAFRQEFAMPHMLRFTERCEKEGFSAPLMDGKHIFFECSMC